MRALTYRNAVALNDSHEEAIALNNAHDAEQAAWKAFLATKVIRDHAILDASRAFKAWQVVREHQRSLGGECY
jgi:hypothetical protein